jgi:hypothetical protein
MGVLSVWIGLIDRADATTMEGTANLMVELRAGLDAAAQEIGAERLLLSVCISSEDLSMVWYLMSSTLLLVEVLGISWISPRWIR